MKKIITFLVLAFISLNIFSEINFSGDISSNFLFRGIQISDKIQVQPTISFSTGNINKYEIGTWSSFALDGSYKEVDLYTKYSYKNVSLTITDYMFNTKTISNYSDSTNNAIETSISYSFNIPLTLSYNIFVWGYDKNLNNKQLYSSYIESSYAFKNISIFLGITPYESFYAKNFAIVNTGITLYKNLTINEFKLPIKTSLIVNPNTKTIFANFTLTL